MPIDLCFKTNLSIVNALWMILVGERFNLNDQGLQQLVRSVENVLKSAQVASLLSILCPDLFKWIHPRFKRAKDTFDDCKTLMRNAIQRHLDVSTVNSRFSDSQFSEKPGFSKKFGYYVPCL